MKRVIETLLKRERHKKGFLGNGSKRQQFPSIKWELALSTNFSYLFYQLTISEMVLHHNLPVEVLISFDFWNEQLQPIVTLIS